MYKINYILLINTLRGMLKNSNDTALTESNVLLHNEKIYKLIGNIRFMEANLCHYKASLHDLEKYLDADNINSALNNAKTFQTLRTEAKTNSKSYKEHLNELQNQLEKISKSRKSHSIKTKYRKITNHKIHELISIYKHPLEDQRNIKKLKQMLGVKSLNDVTKIISRSKLNKFKLQHTKIINDDLPF